MIRLSEVVSSPSDLMNESGNNDKSVKTSGQSIELHASLFDGAECDQLAFEI